MKILFLHGKESSPNSTKATFLRGKGHEVHAPVLDKDDWEQSVLAARHAIDHFHPDVIVGSSRGGAVAMAATLAPQARTIPLVLIAPAWIKYAPWATCNGLTIVIHSIDDEVVPHHHSEKLQRLYGAKLITAGMTHRMIDYEALDSILAACEDQERYLDEY
jgi:hypothetical protein